MTQTAERTRPAPTGPGGMHTGRAILVILLVVVVGWLVLHHRTTTTHAGTTPTTAATSTGRAHARHHPADDGGARATRQHQAAGAQRDVDREPLRGVERQTQGQPRLRHAGRPQRHRQGGGVRDLCRHARLPARSHALAVAVGLPATAVNATTPPPTSAPIPGGVASTANLVLVIGPDLAGSA